MLFFYHLQVFFLLKFGESFTSFRLNFGLLVISYLYSIHPFKLLYPSVGVLYYETYMLMLTILIVMQYSVIAGVFFSIHIQGCCSFVHSDDPYR